MHIIAQQLTDLGRWVLVVVTSASAFERSAPKGGADDRHGWDKSNGDGDLDGIPNMT
jgi:hypothetical protein